MEEKLKKRFYKNFYTLLIVLIITSIIIGVVNFIMWFNLSKNLLIVIPIAFTTFFLIFLIISIKNVIPFVKDIKNIRGNVFERFTGKVVGFHKIKQGGEPDTVVYNPIVSDSTGHTIELSTSGTQNGCIYNFVYLKNTKIAVFEVILND